MTNADNNINKEHSREQLAIIANSYLNDLKSISMCDFLGIGIGAEYYSKNIKNLNNMCLVENKIHKINLFRDKHKDNLVCSSNKTDMFRYNNISINVFNHDMSDILKYFKFDILNLDFCAPYYYRENKTNIKSTVDILIQAFLNNSIRNGGLLFTTFQITGRAVNIIKESYKDKSEISQEIIKIADIFGYKLEEIYGYQYKSGRPTTMLQLGYQCIKM